LWGCYEASCITGKLPIRNLGNGLNDKKIMKYFLYKQNFENIVTPITTVVILKKRRGKQTNILARNGFKN